MIKSIVAFKNRATIGIVKLVRKLIKLMGKGQGTALPGLLLNKLSPELLKYFSDQIPHKILITGTNGKTTTQNALSSILKEAGYKVLYNGSGSNMKRGLLSLFAEKCDKNGKLNYDYAVLEIEEATLPKIVNDLNPEIIVFTNLYRDQLDAYGEIDRTKSMFVNALKKSPNTIAVINGDDPRLISLTKGLKNKEVKFALNPEYIFQFKYEGESIKGENNKYIANKIKINDDLGTEFSVNNEKYSCSSPGIYNVYNALAAITVAFELEIKLSDIKKGLLLMKTPFGRGEIIKKNNINYRLLLTKNPAGLNLVFQLLNSIDNPSLIILLNDKIADGKDISWIWDSDFEMIESINPSNIILGGSRAHELLLRLKYSCKKMSKISEQKYLINNSIKVYIVQDIKELVNFVNREDMSKYYYVIHTYTAMLEFRKILLGKAIDE